jgi:C-methyltransferase C-terminal domain/Putative zinc binding domain/Methyltransferase domain
MAAYRELASCRISGSADLVPVLDLGQQVLTGVFPKSLNADVTRGPLQLVWCPQSKLAQLAHTYNASDMYGDNYGYRSGLNQSMVDHLTDKVRYLERLVDLRPGDVVLDIGSNDATTLKAYGASTLKRVGIDPTGKKFSHFYPPEIRLVPDFFSAAAYRTATQQPARIVTSISMLYDLDAPVDFARQVAEILAPDGLWHFEQSYLPAMLRANSYDTICHEHLEYYSLGVIETILGLAGLQLVDIVTNAVNGGSFAVSATHRANRSFPINRVVIDWMLEQEERMGLQTTAPYRAFEQRVVNHREDLVRLVRALGADGQRVLGYGASTKGNVTLQYCGFTARDIAAIADVNPDKFGCFTPGSGIPIVSEGDARAMNPDYFLVLPWHFKDSILRREKEFLQRGGKFIFPFPEIEIV